jgi:hypothetical protein
MKEEGERNARLQIIKCVFTETSSSEAGTDELVSSRHNSVIPRRKIPGSVWMSTAILRSREHLYYVADAPNPSSEALVDLQNHIAHREVWPTDFPLLP